MEMFELYSAPGSYDDIHRKIFPEHHTVNSLESFKKAVAFQHTAVFCGNAGREDSNFIASNAVVMDVDNDHSENPAEWLSVEDMANYFPGVCYYTATSRNNNRVKKGKAPRPKFHVYFPIREVYDINEYRKIKTSIHDSFPLFDPGALSATQMTFSHKDVECTEHDGTRSITDILTTTEEKKPKTVFRSAKDIPAEYYEACLNYIDPVPLSYDRWSDIGMALRYEGGKPEVFHDWCQRDPERYSEDRVNSHWDSYNRTAGHIVTGGTIIREADKNPEYRALKAFRKWPGCTDEQAEIMDRISSTWRNSKAFFLSWNADQTHYKPLQDARKYVIENLIIACRHEESPESMAMSLFRASPIWSDDLDHGEPLSLAERLYSDCMYSLELKDPSINAPSFYSDKGSFLAQKCAGWVSKNYHAIREPQTDQMYYYIGNTYIKEGPKDRELKALLNKKIIPGSNQRQRSEVVDSVKNLAEQRTESPTQFIAFKNGVLNTDTGEFLPPDPEYFIKNTIPHDYDPKAPEVPEVDEVLNQWAGGDPDVKEQLLEIAGYSMCRHVEAKAFFILKGDGNDGKSAYLRTVTQLIGDENVTNIPAEKLKDESSFYGAELNGTLANICGDNKDCYLGDMSIIKRRTGKDSEMMNKKFQGLVNSKPMETHIFAYNSLPRLSDPTGVLFNKRLKFVHFNTFFYVPGETDPERERTAVSKIQADPKKEEIFSNPEAMAYMIRLSVEALFRFKKRGWKFIQTEQDKATMAEYAVSNNPVMSFLTETYGEIKDDIRTAVIGVSTETVYSRYTTWNMDNGYSAKSKNVFVREVCGALRIKAEKGPKDEYGLRPKVFKEI